MKARNLVVYALAAAALGMASQSFAQGPRHEPAHKQRIDERRDFRHDRRDFRPAPVVRHQHYYNARGPQFQRGRYIPREYRGRQYVVTNPRAHKLYAPPRGHQWVQVGSDYVLVAIATGLIANLIFNH